ncbi:CASP-like protein 5A2 [Aegilops tauschii subsp. strangulata]|uniref:CASP-like protein 5A2 n=1 Tax=Aegilops tauschii subsp. strangulata TaxID=200361 RepID=UPI003CC841F7
MAASKAASSASLHRSSSPLSLMAACLLVAAASLQCLWSLALGAVDIYALLVKRSFRSPRATTIYSIGDWVSHIFSQAPQNITALCHSFLVVSYTRKPPAFRLQVTGALTFAAASGSAGITILLDDDLMLCSENHCPSFMAATAMAFFSWFAIAPSCLFNLMMAVYRVQRAS